MDISKPEIIQKNGQIIYRVSVQSSEGSNDLWYSMEEKFGDLVTEFSDAPLVTLLIPAIASSYRRITVTTQLQLPQMEVTKGRRSYVKDDHTIRRTVRIPKVFRFKEAKIAW